MNAPAVLHNTPEKLENLNQKIQRVNLLMPTRNRQYALINRAQMLTRFQKACPGF